MAQNAQMAGLVTDPSGAVIPGATITITNVDTGVAIKTVSNGQGYYTVPQLQPGHYRLNAAMAGFKDLVREGIVLQVDDNVALNIAMQVGAATQVVNITAEAPVLRTTDAQARPGDR